MNPEKTGAFIAQLRKEQHLTQAALAERLSISNRTVSKWETGDGLPDIAILPRLADALGVTVDELLRGERAPDPVPRVRVTEVADRDSLWNTFRILDIIAVFFAIFAALLGTISELYCSWAFAILFYTHWEIIFAVMSLFASVAAGLLYSVGVMRLGLSYTSREIRRMTHQRTWALVLILLPFPLSFLYRVCMLMMPGIWPAVTLLMVAAILLMIYLRCAAEVRDET